MVHASATTAATSLRDRLPPLLTSSRITSILRASTAPAVHASASAGCCAVPHARRNRFSAWRLVDTRAHASSSGTCAVRPASGPPARGPTPLGRPGPCSGPAATPPRRSPALPRRTPRPAPSRAGATSVRYRTGQRDASTAPRSTTRAPAAPSAMPRDEHRAPESAHTRAGARGSGCGADSTGGTRRRVSGDGVRTGACATGSSTAVGARASTVIATTSRSATLIIDIRYRTSVRPATDTRL